ncbi:MAG: cbb3-type cytochrome c oxidase subunit I [Chitinophagaceae bacterium]|nr:cbb3-type cytochrome c oxidase subunit I [Chitinophagaceae bacterium]
MTEQSNNKLRMVSRSFLLTGMLLLAAGMVFGLTGALQYLVPGLFKSYLSFEKIRPLHVSSMVFWILFAASGGVLSYLQQHTGRPVYSNLLLDIQFKLFVLSIILILYQYFAGVFGGREYWEFHPILAIPFTTGWVLFGINFFKTLGSLKKQPVYVWMWTTGIIFFLFTFAESYLWLIPYFRNNIVNDMTIQWKSYGSMVGAWNMLIYGSSLFLLEKISGNKKYSNSPMSFALYFTGLFNLMFNWGHHIYTLPTHGFIKNVSYLVSMTELLILGRIIWQWKSSVTTAARHFHHVSYRFMVAADAWIFLTLLLAIVMSVPAINVYTHGTHITVAHTMGATIGINSFLLLAIAFDQLEDKTKQVFINMKWLNRNYWIANISLFVFWISLIIAGILRSRWQMSGVRIPFSSMMEQLRPLFMLFFVSGAVLMVSLLLILGQTIKNHFMRQL